MFTDKDIIITGGAGFIGSNMAGYLIKGNRVTVVDNLSNVDERYISGLRKNSNFKFLKVDIAEAGALDKIGKADIVIHLAANSDVRGGSASPETDSRLILLRFFRTMSSNPDEVFLLPEIDIDTINENLFSLLNRPV